MHQIQKAKLRHRPSYLKLKFEQLKIWNVFTTVDDTKCFDCLFRQLSSTFVLFCYESRIALIAIVWSKKSYRNSRFEWSTSKPFVHKILFMLAKKVLQWPLWKQRTNWRISNIFNMMTCQVACSDGRSFQFGFIEKNFRKFVSLLIFWQTTRIKLV